MENVLPIFFWIHEIFAALIHEFGSQGIWGQIQTLEVVWPWIFPGSVRIIDILLQNKKSIPKNDFYQFSMKKTYFFCLQFMQFFSNIIPWHSEINKNPNII